MSHDAPITLGPRPRLPDWLRLQLPRGETFGRTRALLGGLQLHTVCESARCPNHWECWGHGTATFMIAGDRCTRACRFCAVTPGAPDPLDADEPRRVGEAVRRLGLRHVVITSVTRDDLPDGGAAHFRQTVEAVRAVNSKVTVEILTPDFNGDEAAIAEALAGGPDVFNHNLETVRRLTPLMRSKATYDRSLGVLRSARRLGGPKLRIKSGLMAGLGERAEEVLQTMDDLRAAGVDLLTIGQYLQPDARRHPVVEFVTPAQFEAYRLEALRRGFRHAASAPMVRSSYHAGDSLTA